MALYTRLLILVLLLFTTALSVEGSEKRLDVGDKAIDDNGGYAEIQWIHHPEALKLHPDMPTTGYIYYDTTRPGLLRRDYDATHPELLRRQGKGRKSQCNAPKNIFKQLCRLERTGDRISHFDIEVPLRPGAQLGVGIPVLVSTPRNGAVTVAASRVAPGEARIFATNMNECPVRLYWLNNLRAIAVDPPRRGEPPPELAPFLMPGTPRGHWYDQNCSGCRIDHVGLPVNPDTHEYIVKIGVRIILEAYYC
ncbi:hypothetical protein EJ03DRAFT_346873 [Teratosphaeria nubilosa]|uniref:Uncharacterized protein n=1 Tax=Teratosphaeria nubilosa TaxID=161662 RepID=A0A6G1LNN7_9PEZI|nr:hypothetical protein EJ03DRAFT_346873 [Teratosphaeria nubilosa]